MSRPFRLFLRKYTKITWIFGGCYGIMTILHYGEPENVRSWLFRMTSGKRGMV